MKGINIGYASVRGAAFAIAFGLLLSGLAIGSWIALLPLEVPQARKTLNTRTPKPTPRQTRDIGLEELLAVTSVRLQRPLKDPPPEPVVESKRQVVNAPELNLELTGTAVESDQSRSRAWLKIDSRPAKKVQIGDSLPAVMPEAIVKAIEVGVVVIDYAGREIRVESP
ncbi:MAG: type II secretion system protein N [Planctomycetota bacterium]